jgi:hypothetical protein
MPDENLYCGLISRYAAVTILQLKEDLMTGE